jgi:hypothetical protein
MNNIDDELDKIEEDLKEQEVEEEKTHHKVSGKSVFEIQEIIKEKGKKIDEDKYGKQKNE